MEDMMGLSVGSFAEDEACRWTKSTVRTLGCWSWCAMSAACLSPSGWRQRMLEFLAALKRVAQLPQLEVGAKMSSTEKKAVLVLKQHALVTVDDKDLVAIHSLTQVAVRGQTDKRDRRALAADVARALEGRLAKLHHHKPSTFFIGRRYAAHARAAAAKLSFPALASPGAAHWVSVGPGGGGEARGGRSLLGDVGECACRRGLSLRR